MTTEETTEQPPVDDLKDCLKERKWWCFLLSSIFTFLAGLLIVLLWRAFAFLCCRKEPELSPNDPKQKEQKTARQGKEFEGTFMTEAKDWAGELISGQTTTGRILVSLKFSLLIIAFVLFALNSVNRYDDVLSGHNSSDSVQHVSHNIYSEIIDFKLIPHYTIV